MKSVLNVLGCIAAVILSIILILVVTAFSLYNGVASFAKPEVIADTVTKAVQNIELDSYLPSAEELQEILPIEGVTNEAIEELLTSDTATQVIGLYAQDVLDMVLKGDEAGERQFTAEALKALANEEIDDIVETIKPYIPEEVPDETIAEELKTLVDTHADVLVEALPLPVAPSDTESDPFKVIRQFLDPAITTAFIIAILLLVILIYLCRFPRFGGMLWLGVDAVIAALLTTALSVAVGSSLITTLLTDLDPSVATLVDPIVAVLTHNLTVSAIICTVLAVALIVGYILLRRNFVKPAAVSVEESLPETLPAE